MKLSDEDLTRLHQLVSRHEVLLDDQTELSGHAKQRHAEYLKTVIKPWLVAFGLTNLVSVGFALYHVHSVVPDAAIDVAMEARKVELDELVADFQARTALAAASSVADMGARVSVVKESLLSVTEDIDDYRELFASYEREAELANAQLNAVRARLAGLKEDNEVAQLVGRIETLDQGTLENLAAFDTYTEQLSGAIEQIGEIAGNIASLSTRLEQEVKDRGALQRSLDEAQIEFTRLDRNAVKYEDQIDLKLPGKDTYLHYHSTGDVQSSGQDHATAWEIRHPTKGR